MALKVGELYASLGLDDKNFEKTMKQSESKFSSFGKNLGKIAGAAAVGLGSAVAGAGAAMGGLVAHATSASAEINKFSQTAGMSMEAFQEWDYVAKNFGFSMEQAAGDIAMFSERAMDAAKGTGEGAELFKELGVAVTDNNGQLKSQEQLFNETIGALQGMENVTKRNALATAILGTTGEELAPVLNMTNKELENMKGNANVISEDQIKQAEKFRLGWQQLKNQFSTVGTQIGVELMPMFQYLFEWINENMPMIQEVIQVAFDIIRSVISSVVTAVQTVITWFQTWFTTNQETMQSIWETIQTVLTQVKEFIMTTWNNIKQFWQQNGQQIMQAVQNAFSLIQSIIQTIMPAVLFIIKTVWENIKGVINGALKVIMGIIEVFTGIFTGDISKMWEGIKSLFSGALQAIWNLFNLMIVGKVVALIKSFAKIGISLIKRFITNIVSFFKGLANQIGNIIPRMWNAAINQFKVAKTRGHNIVNSLKNAVTSSFKALKRQVKSIWNSIKDAIIKPIKNALNLLKNLGGSFLSAGKGLINQMVKGIKNAAGKAIDAVKNIADKVRNFLPFSPAKEGPLSDLDKLDFGGPIKDSIKRSSRGVQNQLSRMLQPPEVGNLMMENGTQNMNKIDNISSGRPNIGQKQQMPQTSNISLVLGGQEFEAHVDDITKTQEQKKYRLKKKRG
ncbi:phage tail tape measure protein, TP901 family, core region [Salinibacillus kushneri]|uniref:Phage tail tape measure protein, TP901 family, core region n=1 Tax=Salinibacillus kushneri TaxID=237682 RepID=A0A1I0ID32_9BACI|nr:phage tail tape measure protein [Salinibacillus kushneri]SET94641.1 phage tail tape measure protein, TP901 family, core region [Salinibacillus kushneri]